MLAALTLCLLLPVTAQDEPMSGPKVGAKVPGRLPSYNINGKRKDFIHCLICEHNLKPTVMILTKVPADGKDAGLKNLLAKLEEAVETYKDKQFQAFAIVIDGAGRTSATEAKIEDADKLVKEANDRRMLEDKLRALTDELKLAKVVV